MFARLMGGKGQKGGAIEQLGGTLTLRDVLFEDNTAVADGGAVSGPGDVTLLHTTLVGNLAPSGSASSAAQLQALNSLLVAPPDADDAVCAEPAVDPTGSAATDLSCGATLAADLGPAILIPAGIGTMAAFDLRPSFVDAADPALCQDLRVEAMDQYGAPRPLGEACDIGAFEYYPDFQYLLP